MSILSSASDKPNRSRDGWERARGGERAEGSGERAECNGAKAFGVLPFRLSPLPSALSLSPVLVLYEPYGCRHEPSFLKLLCGTGLSDRFRWEIFAGSGCSCMVPDLTRTAPLPLLLDALWIGWSAVVRGFDVLVALGDASAAFRVADRPAAGDRGRATGEVFAACRCSTMTGTTTRHWSRSALYRVPRRASCRRGLLSLEVPVRINARVRDYDVLLVLGPVFPHEVVGFSGGNKYFFPGISGPELLNFFHWLGALITNEQIIGVAETPVRRVIDRAATSDSGRTPLRGVCRRARRESARLVLRNARGRVDSRRPRCRRGCISARVAAAVPAGAFLCARHVRRAVGRGQVHVQARAGRGRRGRADHLRPAPERDLA